MEILFYHGLYGMKGYVAYRYCQYCRQIYSFSYRKCKKCGNPLMAIVWVPDAQNSEAFASEFARSFYEKSARLQLCEEH